MPGSVFEMKKEIQNTFGSGLFVTFSQSAGIDQYRIGTPNIILNGVKITTSEFDIEAEASLFFMNGLIDFLEIWCYIGDYPNHDMTKYTLMQIWTDSNGRQISTENSG